MRNENIKQSKRAHTHTHTQISSLEELCSLPLPTYKEQEKVKQKMKKRLFV